MTRRFLATFAPLAPAVVSMVLLAARIAATRQPSYAFLVWNMVLAVVPFLLSMPLASALSRRRFGLAVWLGVPWLLFLPNAPYLVTDLIHLRERVGVPYWFDIALFGATALAGISLGVGALARVERAARVSFGRNAALGLVLAASLASGFGIWLGRFGRFNSWDLVASPKTLLAHALAPLLSPRAHPQAIGVTLVFGAVFASAYFALTRRDGDAAPASGSRELASR